MSETQTREALVEVMKASVDRTRDRIFEGCSEFTIDEANTAIVSDLLLALEAAGVRLVPVDEKPGQGWLHEAVKDASLRDWFAALIAEGPGEMVFVPTPRRDGHTRQPGDDTMSDTMEMLGRIEEALREARAIVNGGSMTKADFNDLKASLDTISLIIRDATLIRAKAAP